MGLTAYLESTLLEISNDVKFVEILVKTTESTIRCNINLPGTHVGHMTVSNLLCYKTIQVTVYHKGAVYVTSNQLGCSNASVM